MAYAAEVTRGRWIALGGRSAQRPFGRVGSNAVPRLTLYGLFCRGPPSVNVARLTQSDTRVQIDERSAKNVETTLSVSARGCPLDGRIRGVGRRNRERPCMQPALRPDVQSPEVLRDQGQAADARDAPSRQTSSGERSSSLAQAVLLCLPTQKSCCNAAGCSPSNCAANPVPAPPLPHFKCYKIKGKTACTASDPRAPR